MTARSFALVERAIERLDEQDGDPDLEDDDPLEDNHDTEESGLSTEIGLTALLH